MPKGNNQTKRKNIEYIKEQIKNIATNTQILSTTYSNNKEKLKFECECGKIFYKNWTTIQSNKTCQCRECTHKNSWRLIRREKDFSIILEKEFNEFGFYPEEKVVNIKQKILCHDDEGYLGYISLENIRLGKHFSIYSVRFNKQNLLHNLNNFSKINQSGTEILSFSGSGRSCDILIKCQCSCGENFITNVCNFTTQHKWRCGRCSNAKSNIELLAELEIGKYVEEYVCQKRFDGCRSLLTHSMLPFDFYIPSINLCIEIDGEQHFSISQFGNETKEEQIRNLQRNKEHDLIKNNFCKSENINLVRISYKAFKRGNTEYKQIIKNLFNRL